MTPPPVGLTQDAGWQIGASRTFPVDRETAWELIVSPAGLAAWLGDVGELPRERGAAYRTADGAEGELRSFRRHNRLRLTWRPPGRAEATTLQVALADPPSGRGTVVRFHNDRLAGAAERERMRDHWRAALDRLGTLLDGAD